RRRGSGKWCGGLSERLGGGGKRIWGGPGDSERNRPRGVASEDQGRGARPAGFFGRSGVGYELRRLASGSRATKRQGSRRPGGGLIDLFLTGHRHRRRLFWGSGRTILLRAR